MGDFVTPLQDILTHYPTSRADKVYAKILGVISVLELCFQDYSI